MRSLMTGLAKAMNLVNPEVEHHHEQTAYMALFIGRAMGLPEEDALITMYAALLHDIGSFLKEAPQSIADVERNAREISLAGAKMIADLPGCEDIAGIIEYSQCSWRETVSCAIEEGAACERLGRLASIVHLADVVSLMVDPDKPVLNQVQNVVETAKACSGTQFAPEVVDALVSLSGTEYIWMDLAHNPMFLTYFTGDIAEVSLEEAVGFTGIMSRIIDYRSPFTAMHSAGVAASARTLGELAGLGGEYATQLEIAGNLHDVGKLAVPRAILEKPGKLTNEEFNIVKEHPYYTSLVMLDIKGFENISQWGMKHHEKMNGRGYPFHYDKADLDTGARILAVADIFSAITEERPYRAGMTRERAADVLMEDVRAGAICNDVVTLLIDNYDQVDAARDHASRIAGKRYFDSLQPHPSDENQGDG